MINLEPKAQRIWSTFNSAWLSLALTFGPEVTQYDSTSRFQIASHLWTCICVAHNHSRQH